MAKKRASISTQFLLVFALILVINGVVFFFMLQSVYREELKAQAQTLVANVESFGTWVANNGRVWVKDNSASYLGKMEVIDPQNPDNYTHFYSKNPALAQREFSETVEASASPAKFRMTSSNVMNPNNAPDAFEQQALQAIKTQGLSEYFGTVGNSYRYAKPVYHNASCIACHGEAGNAPSDVISRYGDQNGFGFKVGDVAGIISVTIPRKNLLSGGGAIFGFIEMGAIAFSVLLILWFIRRSIILPIRELTTVAEKISTGEADSLDTDKIARESKNEIDQLTLATGRMASSFALSKRKMLEYRQTAAQAVKVAKALKAKQGNAPK